MNKNKLSVFMLVLIAVIQFPMALAYDQGDWVIRFGAATVSTHDDSDSLWTDQTGSLPNTFVETDVNTQIGLSATYMFNGHFGLEILAATPFRHDIKVESSDLDGALDNLNVGSTKQLPPTVSLQYYMMMPDSTIQPYVGLGVNYTAFFSEDLHSDAKSILDADSISLKNSWGLAAQFGVDFKINNDWSVNVSAMWADIGTEATIHANGGDALGAGIQKITVDTELDPWVYRVNLSFVF